MHMKRLAIFFCLAVTLALPAKPISYATHSLERLANYVGLTHLDGLDAGVHNGYTYKGSPLTVRVNEWNEVEHIGLHLFSQEIRTMQPLPLYDFLERYLLALNAAPEGSDERVYMAWDKVHYTVGDAKVAMKLDTTAVFTETHIDRHVYKVAWSVENRKRLEMSFYMDYQLLVGCNAIELEQIMFRKIRRGVWMERPHPHDGFPAEGTEFTLQGKNFISPLVRSDVYYTRKRESDAWSLLEDAGRMGKTIANIMLSDESAHELKVRIKLDKYGLRTDSATVAYSVWRQLCIDEGCTPYFGIKSKEGDVYKCSVFMVNETGGYLHLLSVDIPHEAVTAPQQAEARATIFCYIPLHNASDNIFRADEFSPIQ